MSGPAPWGDAAPLISELQSATADGGCLIVKIDNERDDGRVYTVVVNGRKYGGRFFRKDSSDLVGTLREEKVDVVFARRTIGGGPRPGSQWLKRSLIIAFRSSLPPEVGTFCAMTRRTRQALDRNAPRRPYLLSMVLALRLSTSVVDYAREPRREPGTGYTLASRIRLGVRATIVAAQLAWRRPVS